MREGLWVLSQLRKEKMRKSQKHLKNSINFEEKIKFLKKKVRKVSIFTYFEEKNFENF